MLEDNFYFAPEIRGNPKCNSPSASIWSLGATVFWLMTRGQILEGVDSKKVLDQRIKKSLMDSSSMVAGTDSKE